MPAHYVDDLVATLFSSLDPATYLTEFPFDKKLGVNRPLDEELVRKVDKDPLASVDPENRIPFPPEFDDLIRLHWVATSRRSVTVLEIGSGFSTSVLNDAMETNARRFPEFDGPAHRKSDVFRVHSLDSSQDWIDTTRNLGNLDRVEFHHSEVDVTLFAGRVCTMFRAFPNVSPDLIYLDGPDQHNVHGNVRTITTAHKDRFPMSGDLLTLEHFLAPGTLIVVDGRTANARFLACNLQRNWAVERSEEFDQTFFELRERPLGRFNAALMGFQFAGRKTPLL